MGQARQPPSPPAAEALASPGATVPGSQDPAPAVRWAGAQSGDDAGRVEGLAHVDAPGRRTQASSDENPLRSGTKTKPIRPQSGTRPGPALQTKAKGAPPVKRISEIKRDRPPFDPIEAHGAFFEKWPVPKLALVITGRMDGYLEPCGCAGLDRMKGGIGRRYAMLEDLRRKRGWPVVAVDVGGNAKGFGKQADLKFQTVAEALKKMGYDAIGLGKAELKLPAGEVAAQVASVDGKESVFVSANVALYGFDVSGFTVQKRTVQCGGRKVGITAVLGPKYQKEINNSDVKMTDAQAALAKASAELRQEKCDLLILLAYATMDESTAFAKSHPEFDVVVTSDGAYEPPANAPPKINGRPQLIEVGEKGMTAVVLGFYDSPAQPVRYQRVFLDSRYAIAPEMQKLMEDYRNGLERAQEEEGLKGLGIRPMPNPRAELMGAYVGSAKCESCHEESYRIWKKSKHAQAYRMLVEAKPSRNFDPECLACHVIGWDPAQFTPYEGGYSSVQKTPLLVNVGCESCHGPGEAHIAAEAKNDPELQKKMQKATVVTKEESEKQQCATCHDLDNSPEFDFKTYWPDVEHYENKDQ